MADALKEFEGWHPQICEIIRSVDATNRWALYDRDPLPRWTVGRVTLMGDAAHPMLPAWRRARCNRSRMPRCWRNASNSPMRTM